MFVSGNFCSPVVSTGIHTPSEDVCSAVIQDINAGLLLRALDKLTAISDVFSRTTGLIKFANYCIEQNEPEATSRAADRIPENYRFNEDRDYVFERLTGYWVEKKNYKRACECADKVSEPSKITSHMYRMVQEMNLKNEHEQAERMVQFLPYWIKNDLLKIK